MEVQAEDLCKTPQRHTDVPAAVCPSAPRKKAAVRLMQRIAPKGGYFEPPDLEIFFAVASRQQGLSLDARL